MSETKKEDVAAKKLAAAEALVAAQALLDAAQADENVEEMDDPDEVIDVQEVAEEPELHAKTSVKAVKAAKKEVVVDDLEEINILDMFANEASSSELEAGVHENVRLVSISTEKRHDNNGNPIKKQLYLRFKKYDAEGNDVGEKDISFFLLDPARDSVMSNMMTFILQTREILQIFYEDSEITEKFDPIRAVWADTHKEEFYTYDALKGKVLKKAAQYKAIESAVCTQFEDLLEPMIGFDSSFFRFKLVESTDAKYIELPRYDRFIERVSIERKNSELLK